MVGLALVVVGIGIVGLLAQKSAKAAASIKRPEPPPIEMTPPPPPEPAAPSIDMGILTLTEDEIAIDIGPISFTIPAFWAGESLPGPQHGGRPPGKHVPYTWGYPPGTWGYSRTQGTEIAMWGQNRTLINWSTLPKSFGLPTSWGYPAGSWGYKHAEGTEVITPGQNRTLMLWDKHLPD